MPLLLDALFWLAVTVVVSLLLLPRMKGAVVGQQWALFMHGFGGESDLTGAKTARAKALRPRDAATLIILERSRPQTRAC